MSAFFYLVLLIISKNYFSKIIAQETYATRDIIRRNLVLIILTLLQIFSVNISECAKIAIAGYVKEFVGNFVVVEDS